LQKEKPDRLASNPIKEQRECEITRSRSIDSFMMSLASDASL
jgi:hypothetical protein